MNLTLNGYLTYLAGVAFFVLGVADFIGVYDVVGQSPEELVFEGLAIMGFRRALNKVGQ